MKCFQINTTEIQVNTPKKRERTILLTEYTILNNKRQTTAGKMETMNLMD